MHEAGDAIELDPAGLPAELLRRMVRACVARIDPTATADGPAYTRLIAALLDGRQASFGALLAAPGARWTFRLAPPRRTT